MELRLPCCVLVILLFLAANGKHISVDVTNVLEGEKIPTHEEGNAEVKNAEETGASFKEAYKSELSSPVNISEGVDTQKFNVSSRKIDISCIKRKKRIGKNTDKNTRSASAGDLSAEDPDPVSFVASRGKRSAGSEDEEEDEFSSEIASECIPTHAMSAFQAQVLKKLGISPELEDDYFEEGFVFELDETGRNFTIRALNQSIAANQFFGLRGKRRTESEDESEDELLLEQENNYIPTRRKRSADIKDKVEDDSSPKETNKLNSTNVEYATTLLNLFPDLHSWPSWITGPDKIRIKRIAGGTDAAEKEFPYQVSLRFQGLHICGGALISERHILTAAHCICGMIEEPYNELTIVTGSVAINNGGQKHVVKDVHCHHDFVYGEKYSWEDDIAVITLNQTVALKDTQFPVKLPTSDAIKSKYAVITGWGKSKPNGYLHNNLQKLPLKLLTNRECQKYYNNPVLPSQICSFNGKGAGACKGDSGSPLVLNGTIIGIFSWTKPCAIGSPEVFTRVHYFLDFIKSSMKDKVGVK